MFPSADSGCRTTVERQEPARISRRTVAASDPSRSSGGRRSLRSIWPFDPDPYALDPEILDLLTTLADSALTVSRPERQFHVRRTMSTDGAANVFGAGLNVKAAPQDLKTLADERLIQTTGHNTSGSYAFHITPLGFQVVEGLRLRVEPQEIIEQEAERYVDASEFRVAYPDAHSKLRAARDLMAADPVANATRIGHDCREAMMAFAGALAEQHDVARGAGPERTVDKIRAVIDVLRSPLGSKTAAFLDALIVFWGTVVDLAQRQEHGFSKQGEPLDADDARRAVFYTGLVMYEITQSVR